MNFTSGLRSSITDNWATPQRIFDKLNKEFNFTLDVCANEHNAKCPKYFDIEQNGLLQDWTKDICYMNPPYGKTIGQWVQKAFETGRNGGLVVSLLPARTDTRWFHEYVIKADELRFIKGRLKFNDGKNSAPFPSMIAIFGCIQGDKDELSRLDEAGTASREIDQIHNRVHR